MGKLLYSHVRVINMKLINGKSFLNITVWMPVNFRNRYYSLNFYELPITAFIGVAQACSKVRVEWMLSPTDSQTCQVCLTSTVGYGIIVQLLLFHLY